MFKFSRFIRNVIVKLIEEMFAIYWETNFFLLQGTWTVQAVSYSTFMDACRSEKKGKTSYSRQTIPRYRAYELKNLFEKPCLLMVPWYNPAFKLQIDKPHLTFYAHFIKLLVLYIFISFTSFIIWVFVFFFSHCNSYCNSRNLFYFGKLLSSKGEIRLWSRQYRSFVSPFCFSFDFSDPLALSYWTKHCFCFYVDKVFLSRFIFTPPQSLLGSVKSHAVCFR